MVYAMLQRFIAFIDRLNERLSPYYVLQQQRIFRANRAGIFIAIFYSLLAVAALVGYVFSDHVERWLREFLPIPELLLPMVLFQLILYIFIISSGPWLIYWVMKKTDPLMFVTALSKREVYFGFRQIETLGSVTVFLGLSPWLAILYHARLISLQWATLYPFLLWLASYTFGNVLFSISVASRRIYQVVLLGILWASLFVGYACGGAALMWAFTMSRVGHGTPLANSIVSLLSFPLARLPVYLLAILLYNLAAWKLCDYNLEESRPFFKKLSVSLGVYFGITLLTAGLWLLLCFLT